MAKIVAAASAMEPVLAELAATWGAPGLAVGIVADGRLVWFKGLGVREVRSGAPVDQDTVFRIASMSKAFISAAVLRLRDEGRLSLDDPAERYLPELRGLVYPSADSPRITVRQLLSHAGGLPEDNATADLRMPMSEAELDRLLAAGLSFSTAPGTRYEYSNLGFTLAGRLVTRASGLRFQDYVTQKLLAPLGMAASRWDAGEVPEEHKAHGYGRKGSAMPSAGLARYVDDALHEEPVLADGAGAAPGGLWTSARDYARWVAHQLAAWPPRDGPDDGPVRRASLREAQEAQREIGFTARRDAQGELDVAASGYGLGWFVASTCRYGHTVQHAGGLPGYGSFVMLLPAHGVGAFSLTNLTYTGGSGAVIELLNGLQARGLLPERPAALSPQLAKVRAAVLELLSAWNAERAAALFDVNHAVYEPMDALRGRIERARRAHGRCEPGPEVAPEDALRGRMRLRCERGELDLSVELTSDVPPRIQTLVLDPVMPPSAALTRSAAGAAGLLSRWEDGAATGLLSPGADLAATRRSFARAAANHGACRLKGPVRGDGATTATFRLACERGEVDLALTLDPADGHVARAEVSTVRGSLRCPR